jgi:hypothetical protein
MEHPDDMLTPRSRHLVGRELATTAVRRALIEAGAGRSERPLRLLMPLARTLGVSVAEIQRLAAYSRQTIYNYLEAEPMTRLSTADSEAAARCLAIALVAAGQEQTLERLAEALNAVPEALLAASRLCDREGWATVSHPGGNGSGSVTLTPREATTEWLRLDVSTRELADRRPGYAVYLAAPPEHLPALAGAAPAVVGLDEASVLGRDVAPSVMRGPELAINVRAGDQRAAIRAAEATFLEITKKAKVNVPMKITQIIPPAIAANAPSRVLDSFVEAMSDSQAPETIDDLRAERELYPGGDPERRLAARCLTWAARELRLALGREDADRAPTISSGDDAFQELIPVSGQLSLSPDQKRIKDPLQQALRLAGETLGPYRGGELGGFKGPGERARIAPEVAPSEDDLVEMARLCGQAVNAGGGDREHLLRVLRGTMGTAS